MNRSAPARFLLGRERTDPGPAAAPAAGVAATFTMAQLSREFGLTPRALRFYENRGFLAPRRDGPMRAYSGSDRGRLALLLKAKTLGFTLREIAGLLEACTDEGGGLLRLSRQQCTDQIRMLERQKRDIEFALVELRREYSNHYLRALGAGETAAG